MGQRPPPAPPEPAARDLTGLPQVGGHVRQMLTCSIVPTVSPLVRLGCFGQPQKILENQAEVGGQDDGARAREEAPPGLQQAQ